MGDEFRGRRHSISSTALWEKCKLAYKLAYIDRVKRKQEAVPVAWRKGSVAHAGLEAAFKGVQAFGAPAPMTDFWIMEPDDPETEGANFGAAAAVRAAWVEYQLDDLPESELDDMLKMLYETLEALGTVDGSAVLGVEFRFLCETEDNAGFIGYADLVLKIGEKSILIRDWKNTIYKKDPDQIATGMQTTMYAWSATRVWPWAETIYMSEYYPPLQDEVMVPMDPENILDSLARFEADVEEIESATEWPPNVAPHCDDCEFREQCPAFVEVHETEVALEAQRLF